MTDLSELHSKTFADQLHTSFNVETGDSAPVSLRLTDVNEPSTPPNIELFSLTFRGPAAPRLPQRTYPVQHEKIGSFNLFLTAIAGDTAGITYEAVFHRLRKKQP
jgi:Domain of unknown function (DUF6916)